jgi:hypothetical protein
MFIKKRNIAALKPVELLSPIIEIKNAEAPSRIPRSPIVTGGIIDLEKNIKIPAHI